jgi:hypothetical protein
MIRSHGLTTVNGLINLTWLLPSETATCMTQFSVEEDLPSDFLFVLDAWGILLTGRNDGYFEETRHYKQRLEKSVAEDIPQGLLPQFSTWLSENYSFITTQGPRQIIHRICTTTWGGGEICILGRTNNLLSSANFVDHMSLDLSAGNKTALFRGS